MLLPCSQLRDSCYTYKVLESIEEIAINVYRPLSAYMIQRRNPLSVRANGMTNKRSTKAELDSSSSSTIPTA